MFPDCTVGDKQRRLLNNTVEDVRESRSLMSATGRLDLVGKGKERVVYEHPANDDCVVKFNRSTKGGNQQEIELSEQSPPISDWFVPVHDHASDGSWLTMPKVETEINMPVERSKEFAQDLKSKGWECPDADFSNFGYKDGEWHLFDYASCEELY